MILRLVRINILLIILINTRIFSFTINSQQQVESIEPIEGIEILPGILGVGDGGVLKEHQLLSTASPPTVFQGSLGSSTNPYLVFNYPEPLWRASANLTSDDGSAKGLILFHQWNPNNFVRITVNATGLPPGKHALHIHVFGDISQGCKSTGPHFQSNFIGNIDVPENGELSVSFFSAFLNMFGYFGVVGRSVVIHEKPIEDASFPPDAFSSPLLVTNTASFQTEENSVGPIIACGIVTITENTLIK